MQSIQKRAAAMSSAPANPAKNLQDLIKKMEGEIKKALPSVITPERFTRIALSAISTNPQLAQCTPRSFLAALMQAAQLGLEPNTNLGQAYLIPYKNGKTGVLECQFQLGYKGLIDLAYRSGAVVNVGAFTVYQNDEFNYELGLEPVLKHKPAISDRGQPIFYYAIFKTKDGGYGFEVMSVDDIKQHRDAYSKAAGKGFSPWATNFDEMAKKTVLKKCLKFAPLKTEFARAVSTDNSIKNEISDDMFAVPDQTITAEFAEEPETEEAPQE